MKNIIGLVVLMVVTLLSGMTYAIEKVVYGTDGRREVYEAYSAYGEWARSTAAMIPNNVIVQNGSSYTLKNFSTLKSEYRLCDSELFLDQPTAANCSGFLVGPDTLVTAGHCITNTSDCSGSSWVFDYKAESSELVRTNFSADQVYKCKSIVGRELNSRTKNDFAVIKLDRPVVGRVPLKVRTSGKVSDTSELIVIGHPSGLPSKVTEGGTLRKNSDPIFFVANLDTFSGNSGSVVLDSKTGMVEGILVRGENDYVPGSGGSCNVVNVCAEGSCRGEDVTRITNLTQFIKGKKRR